MPRVASVPPPPPARRAVGPLTPHLFVPTRQRPVRAKVHRLRADLFVQPHAHPWAQVAFSFGGVTRLTVADATFTVPPSRALWIPAGVEHAVTTLDDCDVHTLYLWQPARACGPLPLPAREQAPWRRCRVLAVSELLRALVLQMDMRPDTAGPLTDADLARDARLSALACDELRRAPPLPLGVSLPTEKRLRALCEAVLDDPARHATLDGWAREAGASARTVARLFQQELGTGFAQWRQQALLAKAVALAAARRPLGVIAAELGYASPSAFSAMVKRSVGVSPSEFLGR